MGCGESSANTSMGRRGKTLIPVSGSLAMTGKTLATTPTSCGKPSMKRNTPASAVAVVGRSSRKQRCANGSHLYTRVLDREEMPSLRSWSGTYARTGDPLHALRAAGSTVRPTQGTNNGTSRDLRQKGLSNVHAGQRDAATKGRKQ